MTTTLPPHNPDLTWLIDSNATTDMAADGLIALSFWHRVEEESIPKALAKAKRHPSWNITKKLDDQTDDAKEHYKQLLSEYMNNLSLSASKSSYVYGRLMANAGDYAFVQAERSSDLLDRTKVVIAMRMAEDGSYKYLECDSAIDYLRAKQEIYGKYSTGAYSELEFMISYLIPALEANGYSRKLVFDISYNFQKARKAIPYLRRSLDQVVKRVNEIRGAIKDATDDEERRSLERAVDEALKFDAGLKEMLDTLIQELGSNKRTGGLSIREFEAKMAQQARQHTDDNQKCLGYIYNLAKGAIVTISVDDRRTLETIKRELERLVDWHLGEPEDIVQEVAKRLMVEELVNA